VYLFPTGDPISVLVEGAAVALSCQTAGRTRPTLTAARALGLSGESAEVYTAGGWLVSYLLDQYGPEKFLSLYAQVSSRASAGEVDAAFESVYGQTFSAIWTAVTAEAQPRNVCPWECSQPSIALDGQPLDTRAGVCGVPNLERTFSIATEETLLFSSDAASFRVAECGHTASLAQTFVIGSARAAGLYRLPAGDYFLEHSSVQGTISGRAALATTIDVACSDRSDGLLAGFDDIYLSLPPSASGWFMPVPWPRERMLTAIRASAQANAWLCASCAVTASGCTSVAAAGAASQSLGGFDVLRFATDPGAAATGFSLVVH
jgi:hypothetical protein